MRALGLLFAFLIMAGGWTVTGGFIYLVNEHQATLSPETLDGAKWIAWAMVAVSAYITYWVMCMCSKAIDG